MHAIPPIQPIRGGGGSSRKSESVYGKAASIPPRTKMVVTQALPSVGLHRWPPRHLEPVSGCTDLPFRYRLGHRIHRSRMEDAMSHHRRDFLANSLLLAAAGVAATGLRPGAAGAQTAPRPIRRSERYDDSFITERKPFKWPGNNTLAVWFAPNVEVWHYDSAVGVGIQPNPTNYVPDVFNYAWREYGMRVGLWRLADVFDAASVKATVALNSQVCEVFPQAVEEMKKRGWE